MVHEVKTSLEEVVKSADKVSIIIIIYDTYTNIGCAWFALDDS